MSTKLQAVQNMEAAAFSGNWDVFKSFLADDIYFRVANRPEIRGPQSVVDFMIKMLSTELAINDLQTRGAWETDDTVVLEMNMKALRVPDNRNVAFPCLDIYRFGDGGKIRDWRVFAIEPTHVH